MQVVIDIPNSVIPLKQDVINLDLHFIDGHICECTFPFKELPKGHGTLIEERYLGELQYRIPAGVFVVYRSAVEDTDRVIIEEAEK